MYTPSNYYNPYLPNQMSQAQMPSYIPPQNNQYITQPTSPIPSPQVLNGKIVDSEDILRVTEVPMGSYGVFPRADFKEIYLKYWKENGTTETVIFKPIEQKVETIEQQNMKVILEKIDNMEQKLNSLLGEHSQQSERKEVKINEY